MNEERALEILLANRGTRDVFLAAEFFIGQETVLPEVEEIFTEYLVNAENTVEKLLAISFFTSRQLVPQNVKARIIGELNQPRQEIFKRAILDFFRTHEEFVEEAQHEIANLLTDESCVTREAAVDFFCSQKKVNKAVQGLVALLLKDEERVMKRAIVFFRTHRNVPNEIREKMFLWLTSDDEASQCGAMRFYCTTEEVPQEIHERITQFLHSTSWLVRLEVIEYFRTRKNVSQEDLLKIEILLDDAKNRIISTTVRFYSELPEVPLQIEQRIARLLAPPAQHVITLCHSILFWKSRKNVPEQVEENLKDLLSQRHWDFENIDFFDCARKVIH